MAAPSVLFINCTLKKSPELSNTEELWKKLEGFYQQRGAATEAVRAVDYDIRFGVTSDEGDGDQWPDLLEKIKAADILVLGSPVWQGVLSATAKLVLERLRGSKKETDDAGRYPMYGKVAATIVTGNEDGAHAVSAPLLYQLQRHGFTIPPQADAYWVGLAGPGPSYAEAGGDKHLFTDKSARILVENTLQLARTLADNPYTTDVNALTEEAERYCGEG